MINIASNVCSINDYYLDVYFETLAVCGNLGCKIDDYAQACLKRETHLMKRYADISILENSYQQDFYLAELSQIQSSEPEERLIYLLRQSQILLQNKVNSNSEIVLIVPNSLNRRAEYTKNLMKSAWQYSSNPISQLVPKIITPQISVLHSLSQCIKRFRQQSLDEIIIGAVDSLVNQNILCDRLIQNKVMTQNTLDKRALGEGAVWIRLRKKKLPNMTKLNAICEIHTLKLSNQGDKNDFYQTSLYNLIQGCNLTQSFVGNIICMGSYNVEEVLELRLLQEFLSKKSGEEPSIISMNSVCGDMGCSMMLFQMAIAHTINQKSSSHSATILWENNVPDTRGIVLLTNGRE